MEIVAGYDASIYIEQAIFEVYKTLLVATGLVVLVIYLFLGSFRAMLVPALTVPVSSPRPSSCSGPWVSP